MGNNTEGRTIKLSEIFWPSLFMFVAGADFERLIRGDVDSLFGSQIMLVFFMVGALIAGVNLIFKLSQRAALNSKER